MIEYIKYNCHIIKTNTIEKTTPNNLLSTYKNHELDYDLLIDNVKLVVLKCTLSSDKTTIFTITTKVENNEIICTE